MHNQWLETKKCSCSKKIFLSVNGPLMLFIPGLPDHCIFGANRHYCREENNENKRQVQRKTKSIVKSLAQKMQ